MRNGMFAIALAVLISMGIAIYMVQPVNGPARDLSLAPNVENGTYLISVGGCIACHTDKKTGRAFLSGGPALKSPFGTFYAPNITPDKQYGIGNWTLAEFSQAISNGHGPGAFNFLYPAFPYDSYTLLHDQDVVDLYAALQKVPPVAQPSTPHELPFPFNVRVSLGGWQHLFFRPHRYEPDTTRSDKWNRGRYLAYGPGHCVACHTPRNLLGARDDSRAFEGSTGGPGGRVPAITLARLTKEGYDHAGLIDTLKTGFTPGYNILSGEMSSVVEDSTSKWHDEDLDALATFLFDER